MPSCNRSLRRFFFAGLLLLLPLRAADDVICAFGPAVSSYSAYQDQRPSGDAMQLAAQVNAGLGSLCRPRCPEIALFRNPTAPNAILTVSNIGDAKIVYAPQFFTTIYESYGDGAIIGVIAHLFGHALDETSPAAWMKPLGSPALRADAWAGCGLAKANLTARGLQDALTALSKYPPNAHPAWSQRHAALRLGYVQCGGPAARFPGSAPQ